MSDVYYVRRRRLKTLLVAIFLSLIFVLILRRYQHIFSWSNLSRGHYLSATKLALPKSRAQHNDEFKAKAPLPPQQPEEKKSRDLLSAFEFTNPPFLNLPAESSRTIPIIVLSKAADVEVRDAVRRTWGFDGLYSSATVQYKVFFLVGTDDSMVKRIQAEQRLFDDLIQVSLPDFPSFLAYRELSAMLWMRTYLPKAPFYIKTEAEVSLNMRAIVQRLLPRMDTSLQKNLIIGWFDREHNTDRGSYQKFINAVVSPSSTDVYYAMGALYIVTAEAWNRMLDASKSMENIQQLGDPFVTGVLREAARVPMKNLATLTDDFKYEIGGSRCKEIFIRDPKLLLCAATAASNRTITDYFDVWNTLVTQNELGNRSWRRTDI